MVTNHRPNRQHISRQKRKTTRGRRGGLPPSDSICRLSFLTLSLGFHRPPQLGSSHSLSLTLPFTVAVLMFQHACLRARISKWGPAFCGGTWISKHSSPPSCADFILTTSSCAGTLLSPAGLRLHAAML